MGFYDFGWVMRLFGTAVGAGILFCLSRLRICTVGFNIIKDFF